MTDGESNYSQWEAYAIDYYAVLGLPDNHASPSAIKHAYHKLSLKFHPDKNPGNEADSTVRFQLLCEAYEILSHDESKKAFDHHGYHFVHRATDHEEGGFGFRPTEEHSLFEKTFGTVDSATSLYTELHEDHHEELDASHHDLLLESSQARMRRSSVSSAIPSSVFTSSLHSWMIPQHEPSRGQLVPHVQSVGGTNHRAMETTAPQEGAHRSKSHEGVLTPARPATGSQALAVMSERPTVATASDSDASQESYEVSGEERRDVGTVYDRGEGATSQQTRCSSQASPRTSSPLAIGDLAMDEDCTSAHARRGAVYGDIATVEEWPGGVRDVCGALEMEVAPESMRELTERGAARLAQLVERICINLHLSALEPPPASVLLVSLEGFGQYQTFSNFERSAEALRRDLVDCVSLAYEGANMAVPAPSLIRGALGNLPYLRIAYGASAKEEAEDAAARSVLLCLGVSLILAKERIMPPHENALMMAIANEGFVGVCRPPSTSRIAEERLALAAQVAYYGCAMASPPAFHLVELLEGASCVPRYYRSCDIAMSKLQPWTHSTARARVSNDLLATHVLGLLRSVCREEQPHYLLLADHLESSLTFQSISLRLSYMCSAIAEAMKTAGCPPLDEIECSHVLRNSELFGGDVSIGNEHDGNAFSPLSSPQMRTSMYVPPRSIAISCYEESNLTRRDANRQTLSQEHNTPLTIGASIFERTSLSLIHRL